MSKMKAIGAIVALVILLLGTSCVYQLDSREQAVILRLGKIVAVEKEAGLHLKTPFVQQVIRFPVQNIEYDAAAVSVNTQDKKNLIFDTIAVFRIEKPDIFYQKVRSVSGAQKRLDDSVYSAIRVLAGRLTFDELLADKRDLALSQATEIANQTARQFGIQILSVAFKRVVLPQENMKAVYSSMRAERHRIASKLRAEGKAIATDIHSQADRFYAEAVSDAQREAEEIMGNGDRKAQETLLDAVGENPELYVFMKQLDFYKDNLGGTRIVLRPDEGILRYLKGVPELEKALSDQ